jgi:RNA polymerase sigma factor (sigma-70 family)
MRHAPVGDWGEAALLRHDPLVAPAAFGTAVATRRVAELRRRVNQPAELFGSGREREGVRAEAFEELFERQFDSVYGYLARRVGPELGRELASETFTRAFAARKRYDPARGEARPWLFGIANNLLRRHYGDEERRLQAFARLDVRDESVPQEEPRLADALGTLPREERDVLLLFAWADLAYAEIATVLELPVGTVRSRLHRARAHVRAALEHEEALDG